MTSLRISALAAAAFAFVSCASKDDQYDTGLGDLYGDPQYGDPYSPNQPLEPGYDQTPLYTADSGSPANLPATSRPAPSPRPASQPAAVHTVVRGDTLGGIANKYGVSMADIKSANNMTTNTVILGNRLQIPSGGRATAVAAGGGGKFHTVVRGDSLSKIASKYGTTVSAIKSANNMKSDVVVLGARLRIPGN